MLYCSSASLTLKLKTKLYNHLTICWPLDRDPEMMLYFVWLIWVLSYVLYNFKWCWFIFVLYLCLLDSCTMWCKKNSVWTDNKVMSYPMHMPESTSPFSVFRISPQVSSYLDMLGKSPHVRLYAASCLVVSSKAKYQWFYTDFFLNLSLEVKKDTM